MRKSPLAADKHTAAFFSPNPQKHDDTAPPAARAPADAKKAKEAPAPDEPDSRLPPPEPPEYARTSAREAPAARTERETSRRASAISLGTCDVSSTHRNKRGISGIIATCSLRESEHCLDIGNSRLSRRRPVLYRRSLPRSLSFPACRIYPAPVWSTLEIDELEPERDDLIRQDPT